MKNFKLILGALLMAISTLSAQKQKKKSDDINYEKIAHVAREKTVKLDKQVGLDKKKQKKKIYTIYENHELQRQKQIRNNREGKKHKNKYRPNRIKVVNQEYEAKKDKERLDKLDAEVDAKILQVLSQKQQRLYKNHKKDESKALAQ